MSMLAPIIFIGAAIFATALAWYSVRQARLGVADIVKQAFRPDPPRQITITYPAAAMPSSPEDAAFAHRSIRRSRPRMAKMPAHRLHSFPHPRRAA